MLQKLTLDLCSMTESDLSDAADTARELFTTEMADEIVGRVLAELRGRKGNIIALATIRAIQIREDAARKMREGQIHGTVYAKEKKPCGRDRSDGK